MTQRTDAVDACRTLLKSFNWSVLSEKDTTRNSNPVWVVTCARGREQFTAEGESQLDAWRNALEAAN